MKLWYGYGSEHSSNLVMIGRFRDAASAIKTKEIIEKLTKQVEIDNQTAKSGNKEDRYTDAMLKLLGDVRIHSVGPKELEQLTYDVKIKVADKELVITTDENDVSAFFKILIDNGARLDVYSAHDYSDTNYGRGK